ncbi:hypothetical protein F7725_021274 [Dissostichus mawsoni]|uniref:Septin-type G domain-containing protein n=1 Tax=Dissostichus mawsoni TaxID=36200 RepID=A0A7J5YFK0_DISMA|nr:hypothetical protein F7725_021274 [Dissostichus mawsoni]
MTLITALILTFSALFFFHSFLSLFDLSLFQFNELILSCRLWMQAVNANNTIKSTLEQEALRICSTRITQRKHNNHKETTVINKKHTIIAKTCNDFKETHNVDKDTQNDKKRHSGSEMLWVLHSEAPVNQSTWQPVNQLDTKEGNIGSITRLTLGERDPTKINKTILLVGETGAGKSTLINALVNYAMGVKYEDNVWYQIVEDEKKSQAESQTSDVIVYEVFGLEDKTLPFSLTIIDTPGYGHTEGIERDVLVSERLLDLFRSTDGVREIDAVCLVLKASDNRLSDRLMYVFDSVVSLFGKDIEKNIVALITHSDFLTPKNVLQALKDAKIRQKTEKNEDNEAQIEHIWNSTMKQISKFAGFLQNTEPQNLKTTIEVLNSRIRLTACIHNLQERVQFIELKQREIKQTQKL